MFVCLYGIAKVPKAPSSGEKKQRRIVDLFPPLKFKKFYKHINYTLSFLKAALMSYYGLLQLKCAIK